MTPLSMQIVVLNSCMLANMYLSRKQAWRLEGSLHPTGEEKRLYQIELQFKGTGGNEDTGLLVLVAIFSHKNMVDINSMEVKLLVY